MPVRVELKPFERIVIGESVIINSASRTCFLVDGEAPILREKDTITAETADTTAKRLYLCVQTMYLKNDPEPYRTAYLGLLEARRCRVTAISSQPSRSRYRTVSSTKRSRTSAS